MGLESLTGFHRTGWRFQKTQSEREKSEETRCLPSFAFNVHLQELNWQRMWYLVEQLVSPWGCSISLRGRSSFCVVLSCVFPLSGPSCCPLAFQGKKMMLEMTVPCAPASQAMWNAHVWVPTWSMKVLGFYCFLQGVNNEAILNHLAAPGLKLALIKSE